VEKTLSGLTELLARSGPQALEELYGDDSVLALRPATGAIVGELGGTQRFRIPRAKNETSAGGIVSPWAATAQKDTIVYPLRKSDRNPFAGVIAVGRRMTSDIVLASSEVSKDHALLKRTADGWALRDSGSRNGTSINFERVASNVDFSLAAGDQLRFADIQGMFLTQPQLVTLLSLVR
jgi:hypothetical protein